jgi:hypothetical protein
VNGVFVGMLNGLKGSPEFGQMLTQCKEAVKKNRSHGHLFNIHYQPEKAVLFIVMFFVGENAIHVCYLPCVL